MLSEMFFFIEKRHLFISRAEQIRSKRSEKSKLSIWDWIEEDHLFKPLISSKKISEKERMFTGIVIVIIFGVLVKVPRTKHLTMLQNFS